MFLLDGDILRGIQKAREVKTCLNTSSKQYTGQHVKYCKRS